MAFGRRVGQRPDCHTFLCKFWHFQMAVSQWKLAWLTPNLGILCISVCSFWLCESIVANPIIYRLVPRPSRFETRQWLQFRVNFEGRYIEMRMRRVHLSMCNEGIKVFSKRFRVVVWTGENDTKTISVDTNLFENGAKQLRFRLKTD